MKFTPPFPACPECGYDHTGLPVDHRCPECGLIYNGYSCYWSPRKPWKAYISSIFVWLFIVIRFNGVIYTVFHELVGSPLASYLAVAMIPIVPVGTFLHYRHALKKMPFVALLPEGIRTRTPQGAYVVPWSEVSMISIVDIHPWIKRRNVDQEISLRGVFDNQAEMKEFKSAASLAEANIPAAIPTP